MNPEFFCCQPFKNGWRLTVLLLFSKCSASSSLLLAVPRYKKWRKTSGFAAIFKLFALLFSNFDKFHFFIFFSKKKGKNLKFSEKLWLQRFYAATHSKMDENLLFLLLLSNFSAGFSLLLVVPRYQKWRKTSCFAAIFKLFALLFSNCDWKNRTFRKTFRIQIFSAASHSKMDENWLFCCCFQIFQLVFHYFWQFPGGKLNVLLLFSNCLRFFSRILTNVRKFSEIS